MRGERDAVRRGDEYLTLKVSITIALQAFIFYIHTTLLQVQLSVRFIQVIKNETQSYDSLGKWL